MNTQKKVVHSLTALALVISLSITAGCSGTTKKNYISGGNSSFPGDNGGPVVPVVPVVPGVPGGPGDSGNPGDSGGSGGSGNSGDLGGPGGSGNSGGSGAGAAGVIGNVQGLIAAFKGTAQDTRVTFFPKYRRRFCAKRAFTPGARRSRPPPAGRWP